MTEEPAHTTIYRHDYRPPDYTVDSIDLRLELGEETTLVRSRLAMRAAHDRSGGERPLVLDGHRFVLRGLRLDGAPLAPEAFQVSEVTLVVPSVPASFTLEVETELVHRGEVRPSFLPKEPVQLSFQALKLFAAKSR